MDTWFKDLVARPLVVLRVLLKAWPAWGAALTAVLTAVATELVPQLPGPWAVRVAAWVVVALGVVASISKAVSRVTPIAFEQEAGLLPLPDAPTLDYDPGRLVDYDPRPTPPFPPSGGRRSPRRG
jgi:hypothetical protein